MVELKIQNLYAWLLFWMLTHFSYLDTSSQDLEKLRCLIPRQFPAEIIHLGDDKVWFRCEYSFDEAIIACLDTGEWNGTLPNCTELRCPIPQEFPAQIIRLGAGNVWIRCKHSSDEARLACLDTGEWNGTLPNCTELRCPIPQEVVADIISLGDGRVLILCDYIPNGVTLECLDNGTWNGTLPICRGLDCHRPPMLDNGWYEGSEFIFPHNVTYHCNSGYVLHGEREIRCGKNGEWAGAGFQKCVKIKCPPPPNLPDGSVSAPSLEFNAKATYNCNEGFLLIGPQVRECLANETWSEEEIICQEVRCPIPQGFHENIQKILPDGRLVFSCKGISHNVTISCSDTGKWIGTIPNCKGCKMDPRFSNGKYNDSVPSNGYFPHLTSLKFECNSSYKLEGEPVSVCQPSETWKPPVPNCTYVGSSGSSLPLKCSIAIVVCLFLTFLFIFILEM